MGWGGPACAGQGFRSGCASGRREGVRSGRVSGGWGESALPRQRQLRLRGPHAGSAHGARGKGATPAFVRRSEQVDSEGACEARALQETPRAQAGSSRRGRSHFIPSGHARARVESGSRRVSTRKARVTAPGKQTKEGGKIRRARLSGRKTGRDTYPRRTFVISVFLLGQRCTICKISRGRLLQVPVWSLPPLGCGPTFGPEGAGK